MTDTWCDLASRTSATRCVRNWDSFLIAHEGGESFAGSLVILPRLDESLCPAAQATFRL